MAQCRQWLEELPPPNGLLEAVQQKGRKALEQYGLPTHKNEDWRLTDLKKIEKLLIIKS